jgi:hypothetical protein
MKRNFAIIILLFCFHVAEAQTSPTRLRLKQLELAPDSTGYVITSDTNRVAQWSTIAGFDTSITNEIQQIDTFSLSGTTLSASLSSDGVAAKTVNLSPILSGYLTGSGTALQIPYWDGTGSITGSNRLTYGIDGFVLIRSDSTVSDRGLRVTQSTDDVAGASIAIRKSRGTIGTPAAVNNGDIIGASVFQGYSGTQYLLDNAYFGANISGTVSAASVPTSVFFIAGSAALKYTPDLLVHHTGKIGIGSTGTGNITTAVPEPPVTLSVFGTDGIRFPQGTTAQRPTGAAGIARFNTSFSQYEGHDGTAWRQMSLPGGTSTYTLRADGSSNWVASSLLTNDGSIIRIIGSSNRFYFSPNNFTDGITPNLHLAALNNAENDVATMAITSKLLWARVVSVLSGGGVMITPSSESVTTSANTMLTINRNVASNLLDLKFNGVTTGLFSTGSDGNGHLLIRSLGTTSNRGLSIYHHQSSIAGASSAFLRSRGTGTSPTALASGDIIGASVFRPYDGSNYTVDNCFFGGSVTGAVSAGNTPSSLFFIAGATSSYLPDLLVHSGGNVGIGSSGTGNITSTINTPPRQLTVYGEARITDLTTDAMTKIVGADGDGDLSASAPGFGLSVTGGVPQVDTSVIATQSDLSGVSVTTLYTGDGTIATDRTVTIGSDKTLTISGTTPDLPGYLYTEEKGYSADWDTWGYYRLIYTDDYYTGFIQGILNYDSSVFVRISAGDWAGDYFASLFMNESGDLALSGIDDSGVSAGMNFADNTTLGGYGARLAGGAGIEFDTETGGKFVYQINNSTKVTLDGTGLGINDTSPEKNLDVGGMGKFRQLSGQDNSAAIGTNANMGTGRSASITDAQSSDVAGRFSFTSGTTLTAGEWVTLTWGTAFDNAPAVVLMPEDANGASITPYLFVQPSTTGCSIQVNVTGVPYEGLTFSFNYIVIQGK